MQLGSGTSTSFAWSRPPEQPGALAAAGSGATGFGALAAAGSAAPAELRRLFGRDDVRSEAQGSSLRKRLRRRFLRTSA